MNVDLVGKYRHLEEGQQRLRVGLDRRDTEPKPPRTEPSVPLLMSGRTVRRGPRDDEPVHSQRLVPSSPYARDAIVATIVPLAPVLSVPRACTPQNSRSGSARGCRGRCARSTPAARREPRLFSDCDHPRRTRTGRQVRSEPFAAPGTCATPPAAWPCPSPWLGASPELVGKTTSERRCDSDHCSSAGGGASARTAARSPSQSSDVFAVPFGSPLDHRCPLPDSACGPSGGSFSQVVKPRSRAATRLRGAFLDQPLAAIRYGGPRGAIPGRPRYPTRQILAPDSPTISPHPPESPIGVRDWTGARKNIQLPDLILPEEEPRP